MWWLSTEEGFLFFFPSLSVAWSENFLIFKYTYIGYIYGALQLKKNIYFLFYFPPLSVALILNLLYTYL